ncbi:unnamed protein product [Brassica oleracea var. botrytis]
MLEVAVVNTMYVVVVMDVVDTEVVDGYGGGSGGYEQGGGGYEQGSEQGCGYSGEGCGGYEGDGGNG